MTQWYQLTELGDGDSFLNHPELVIGELFEDIQYHDDNTVSAYGQNGALIWFRTGVQFKEAF